MTATSAAITRRQWRFALGGALLLTALMLLPYALGYLTAPPDSVFMGIIMNAEDTQTYFAKMLQGYEGAWRYQIPFTPEPHEAVFIGGFYLALGHLARLLNLSLQAVWHLSRIGADLLLGLTTYWFIASFIDSHRGRAVSYLLALFGSGLGWILFLLNRPYWLGSFPVDFHMPEAHLFFTAFTSPHVALGTALLLLTLRLLWQVQHGGAESSSGWSSTFAAALCNLLLVIVYPFLVYLVLLTTFLYTGLLWLQRRRPDLKRVLQLGTSFALPAPLLIYYAAVLQNNPVFAAWDAQALTASPPWPHYLLAFGPLLLFAALTMRKRQNGARFSYLWIWLLAAALLLYAPLNPQRRFVQGAQVPLSILATAGFLGVALPAVERTATFRRLVRHPRYSAPGLRRFLTVLFLAFMVLSNVYVLASVALTATLQQPYSLFRPASEVDAVQWLRHNSDHTEVVLGAYLTGNYVAAQAGNRVLLGHWAETVDFPGKQAAVERFFHAETADVWRRGLLRAHNVAYVWYGRQERQLGQFQPASADYLEPAYRDGEVTIYRVRRQ